jgi:hypothetical protein
MSMGLEVDTEDVEDYNTGLTTEELRNLHMEQQQEVAMEVSSEEEKVDTKGSIATADIKEMLQYWSKTQSLIGKWYPNIAVKNRSISLFTDNVMQHFRNVLRNRQKQMN